MINYFAGLDIFNLSIIWCSIVIGVTALLAVLMLVIRCRVVYFDSEDEEKEIHMEIHPWLSRVNVHSANKKGKRLAGWSKVPNGTKPCITHKIVLLRSVKLYAIWVDAPVSEVVAAPIQKQEPIKELDYSEGVFVKFNYVDTQSGDVIASEGFMLENYVPEEEVIGWGFAPEGKVLFKNNQENYVFSINLYPVTVLADSDIVVPNDDFNGESVVEITYNLSSIDKVVYKETHYLKLKLPKTYNSDSKFIGWSVVPDGDVVIERGDVDSVFTIPLYSVIKEVVEEVESVEAKPLYEEVVEEYIPQTVVEVEPTVEPEPEEVTAEPVCEEIVEEPVVEEPVVEEPVAEPEPILVPTYYDNEGNKIDIKYSRSFTANLIQSDDTVKDYYSELKNHIMSYKGVKSRISWKFDSYNRGRDQLFKIKLRGKTICVYCALDPNEFDESKYHHEPIDAKIFEDVPMLVKIKSGLGLRKAKELVDITMAKFGIEKDEKAKTVDYVAKYPYEPNEPLIARKLIKALIADDAVVVMSSKPKEEIAPVVEPVVEEVVVEPVIEEPVIEEPVIEEPAIEPELVVESVSAEEAHQMVEEKHIEVVIEEGIDYITAKDNKKAIINIDTLSKNYQAGADVTIQSMKDKKLIDKKAKCVKVLARGILDKPLKVRAGEFSVTAAEMILLTGGHAMHVEYKIKK